MKILVISDSHGASEYIVEAISRNKDADAIVFLGDGERDLEEALADCNISPYGDDGSMEETATGLVWSRHCLHLPQGVTRSSLRTEMIRVLNTDRRSLSLRRSKESVMRPFSDIRTGQSF